MSSIDLLNIDLTTGTELVAIHGASVMMDTEDHTLIVQNEEKMVKIVADGRAGWYRVTSYTCDNRTWKRAEAVQVIQARGTPRQNGLCQAAFGISF